MNFNFIDIIVFLLYCFSVLFIGLWVSKDKNSQKKNSKDYFLAGNSLPWWAVGSSIIASNISAEQFIGMSGSGYAVGMAIASYELLAALGLIIIAVVFVPIFLQEKIYTMPQFLEKRFDKNVKTTLAIFWLFVFVFVNLTSILYLGSLAIKNMMGVDLIYGIIFLALFSAIYSIYGGLKAVAITDVIQVVFLIVGGLITTFVAFYLLGDGDVYNGIKELWQKVGVSSNDNRFDMILDKSNPNYKSLPGIGILLGGLWVANLYYWGCNQYIIQRALAAKNVDHAQKGLLFAGLIKLILPIIVVLPGIIAYLLVKEGKIDGINIPDDAYPVLLAMIPNGLKGIAFAALIAAIVSSLASMVNSISTIFTMDIYKEFLNKSSSETHLVKVGRIVGIISLVIAVLIAPLLGTLDQAFLYIQEFTGFISPGALAIFLAAFFYKKATSMSALLAAVNSLLLSLIMKFAFPQMPFLDRMGYVFLACSLLIIIVSFLFPAKNYKTIIISKDLFKSTLSFKIGALAIVLILITIYTIFW